MRDINPNALIKDSILIQAMIGTVTQDDIYKFNLFVKLQVMKSLN